MKVFYLLTVVIGMKNFILAFSFTQFSLETSQAKLVVLLNEGSKAKQVFYTGEREQCN